MQFSFDVDAAPFFSGALTAYLGQFGPDDYPMPFRLFLSVTFPVFEALVCGDRKIRYGSAARSVPDFRITSDRPESE